MSDDRVDLDALEALHGLVVELPKIPRPLYSCIHCINDYSHESRDILWSELQEGWVCDHCWDHDEDGDHGVCLKSLDDFHAAARTALPGLIAELREARNDIRRMRTENEDARNDYRQWRETSARLMEKQDQRIAELEAVISQSPAESCLEERAMGKGGCGACSICCGERGQRIAELEAAAHAREARLAEMRREIQDELMQDPQGEREWALFFEPLLDRHAIPTKQKQRGR